MTRHEDRHGQSAILSAMNPVVAAIGDGVKADLRQYLGVRLSNVGGADSGDFVCFSNIQAHAFSLCCFLIGVIVTYY